MPAKFSVESKRTTFALPQLTRQQIQALRLSLGTDARSIIIKAVELLYHKQLGQNERDVLAELDALSARLDTLDKNKEERHC